MDTTTRDTGRQVLGRFLMAVEAGQLEEAAECVHPNVVMEWPQSGERFTGRENALGAVGANDEKPEFAGEPRIVGAGDVWVVMLPLRYGPDTYQYVGVFELEGGMIHRSTEYFGAPFPAQEARARFADPPGAEG